MKDGILRSGEEFYVDKIADFHLKWQIYFISCLWLFLSSDSVWFCFTSLVYSGIGVGAWSCAGKLELVKILQYLPSWINPIMNLSCVFFLPFVTVNRMHTNHTASLHTHETQKIVIPWN